MSQKESNCVESDRDHDESIPDKPWSNINSSYVTCVHGVISNNSLLYCTDLPVFFIMVFIALIQVTQTASCQELLLCQCWKDIFAFCRLRGNRGITTWHYYMFFQVLLSIVMFTLTSPIPNTSKFGYTYGRNLRKMS